jgi:hypothetical protein
VDPDRARCRDFPTAGTLYSDGIGALQLDDIYFIIQTQGTGPTTLLTVARALKTA